MPVQDPRPLHTSTPGIKLFENTSRLASLYHKRSVQLIDSHQHRIADKTMGSPTKVTYQGIRHLDIKGSLTVSKERMVFRPDENDTLDDGNAAIESSRANTLKSRNPSWLWRAVEKPGVVDFDDIPTEGSSMSTQTIQFSVYKSNRTILVSLRVPKLSVNRLLREIRSRTMAFSNEDAKPCETIRRADKVESREKLDVSPPSPRCVSGHPESLRGSGILLKDRLTRKEDSTLSVLDVSQGKSRYLKLDACRQK